MHMTEMRAVRNTLRSRVNSKRTHIRKTPVNFSIKIAVRFKLRYRFSRHVKSSSFFFLSCQNIGQYNNCVNNNVIDRVFGGMVCTYTLESCGQLDLIMIASVSRGK